MTELRKITPKDFQTRLQKFHKRISTENTVSLLSTRTGLSFNDKFVPQAFSYAAISPTYRPSSIEKQLDGEDVSNVIQALLNVSTPVTNLKGEIEWSLQEDIRRETFKRLAETSQLKKIVQDFSDLGKDTTKKVLYQVVSDTLPKIPELTKEETTSCLIVYDWLEGIMELPPKDEFAAQLELLEIRSILEDLSGGVFVGRENELESLRDYVVDIEDKKPLLLTGPGGMGKSTLLAEFLLQDIIGKDQFQPFTPFAYLDFDRRSLSIEYPVTILNEVLRQLSVFYPKHRQRLQNLRKDWQPRIRINPQIAIASESMSFSPARHTGVYIDEFCNVFRDLDEKGGPLLLILDTFEEVQCRSGDYVRKLFEFLEELSSYLADVTDRRCSLKVLLSGRLPIKEKKLVTNFELKELKKPDAQRFLKLLGVNPSLTLRVVKQVPSIPLTLKLAANLILKSQDEILAQGKFDNLDPSWYSLRDKVRQRFIYQRYLNQISNSDLRKLAYNGLVLRRITPNIIQEVLANPCNLDLSESNLKEDSNQQNSQEKIDEIFETLAKEVSLVSKEQEGILRYRSELRAVMLDPLKQDRPEIVNQIHKNAVSFYKKNDNPISRAEEIYHRLQLNENEKIISDRWLPGIEIYLNGCLSELPLSSRAILATRLGIDAPLEDNDSIRQEIDQISWERYAKRKAERLIKLNEPHEALAVLQERSERLPGSDLFLLEASALKYLSRWNDMRKVALEGISSAAEIGNRELASNLIQILIRSIVLSGQYNIAEEIISSARKLIPSEDSIPSLKYHLELDIAQIQIAEDRASEELLISNRLPDLDSMTLKAPEGIYAQGLKRIRKLIRYSKGKQYSNFVRRATGILGKSQPNIVPDVLKQYGVLDEELNKPQRRLLTRAFITWDEIISANLRQPLGVLANDVDFLSKSKSFEEYWSELLENRGKKINSIFNYLLDQFGLPDNATRRFIEYLQLPDEMELFAPVYTKLLESIESIGQLEQFTSDELGIDLDSITKGTNLGDVNRQLISSTYKEGKFSELQESIADWQSEDTNDVSERKIRLSNKELREIEQILAHSFELKELKFLFDYSLDVPLGMITSATGSTLDTVHDIVRYLNRLGKIYEFIENAISMYPEQLKLREVAMNLGIISDKTPTKQFSAKAIDRPSTYMDSESWIARRSAMELTICRIEINQSKLSQYFTGILVAPNLVLTSRAILKNESKDLLRSCLLSFCCQLSDRGQSLETRTYKLAENPVAAIGSSEELDYVILKTQENPGYETVEAPSPMRRGWLSLGINSRKPIIGEGTYLLQHSQQGLLSFIFKDRSIDEVKDSLICYQCEVSKASIGSPIATTDWHLLAINIGNNENKNFRGLLTQAILEDLHKQNLSDLIEVQFT